MSFPPEDGPQTEADAGASADAGKDNVVALHEVIMDNFQTTTYWNTVPLSGRGPARGTVLVTYPGGSTTAPISSDGVFCRDVPLTPGVNAITLQATDVEGNYTPVVNVEVMQSGSPPVVDEEPPPSPVNVLQGATMERENVWLGYYETDSSETYQRMVDGNIDSYVDMYGVNWLSTDWVFFRLPTAARFSKLVVRSRSDCPLGQYEAMYTDLENPGDPVHGSGDWHSLGVITDGGPDSENLVEPSIARFVAINFIDGCWTDSITETFSVSEIEAWSLPNMPPPAEPPRAPQCLSTW